MRSSATGSRAVTSSRRRSRGSRASLISRPTRRTSRRAVRTFTHPDVDSSDNATAVALGEKVKRSAPAPRDTTVTILNGNGVAGSASTAGFQLGERGYQILTPPNGLPANAPRFDYFRTQVYFAPRQAWSAAGRGEGRESLRLGRAEAPAGEHLPARQRRDAHRRRRPDLPRQPGRVGDRSDPAPRSARTSCSVRTRPATSSASGVPASTSR